jgi:homoserine O-acetyltransferase
LDTLTYNLTEEFVLDSGQRVSNMPITYSTSGQLNADRSNVILVCHALTASSRVHDWWDGLYGPDNVFDPEHYYIICINNMGSPYGSWSPKNINPDTGTAYGIDFPFFTLRDNARMIIAMLSELGIDQLDMLIGGSCGGNIAQEMAYVMGDAIRQLVLMCCSSKESPWVVSIHESQRIALRADPTFGATLDGGKEGIRGARAFALPFYRSHASFTIRQTEENDDVIKDFRAASYVRYQGQKFVDRYDPYCYFHQLNALDTHNIGRDRGGIPAALGTITAQTLCIGFSSDVLIPVIEQHSLAEHIPNAQYGEIETDFGHDAFLIETEALKSLVLRFRTDT